MCQVLKARARQCFDYFKEFLPQYECLLVPYSLNGGRLINTREL